MAVFLQLLGGTLDISPKNPNTLSAIINNKNYSLSRQIKQIDQSQSENEMCYPDKDYIFIISGCKSDNIFEVEKGFSSENSKLSLQPQSQVHCSVLGVNIM